MRAIYFLYAPPHLVHISHDMLHFPYVTALLKDWNQVVYEGIDTKCILIQFQDMFFFTSNQNINHRARDESHLSWVVPLGCLGDVVHEVELASGGLGHLPARRQRAVHIVVRAANVVALLSLVVELQGLVRLENKNNQTFHHS